MSIKEKLTIYLPETASAVQVGGVVILDQSDKPMIGCPWVARVYDGDTLTITFRDPLRDPAKDKEKQQRMVKRHA